MAEKYAAFISYAHRDTAWVRVLQENLERCLQAAGRPGNVFLDEIDLASGRSWVGQLQAGLDRSDQIVLVATPEALASPRVADEWRSFIATRSDWHLGKLHIVQLAEVPLPPFLAQIQFVDFRDADEARYRRALQKLVGGLLGHGDNRNLLALPAGIEIPALPTGRLPAALRARLGAWLVPVLAKKTLRPTIAQCLGLQPEKLEGQDSWACAASAALVWATGQEEPVTAALRIVDALEETFREDEPERAAALAPLRAELAALAADSPQRSLLALWLQGVAKDHERLVPLEGQVDLGLLERVYVQLQVRTEVRTRGAAAEKARCPGFSPSTGPSTHGPPAAGSSWATPAPARRLSSAI